MVLLYAARIEDLKPGDVVVVECGACGHTTAIPHSGVVQSLRLPPTEKVLDLVPVCKGMTGLVDGLILTYRAAL